MRDDVGIIAAAQIAIADITDPIQQDAAPASPSVGMLWLDTGVKPPLLKRWTGSQWETVNDTTEDFRQVEAQLTVMEDNIRTAVTDLSRLETSMLDKADMTQMKELLAEVDSGSGLSGRQKAFHERTRLRDSALLALMLGTGIRVSECVGLNLDDVDMKESGIHIRRKGGKETTVYFNAEVARRLNEYLSVRTGIETLPEQKNALFLSLRNQRITVRSVEYLVKKYASIIAPKKKITPHKLRSSYGSAVYKETNDIYLVADILGHNDVNITRKFYAAIEEDRRKSVKNLDIL